MDEVRFLARYATIALAIIGFIEWFLGRTVSRLAAAPMLAGTPRDIVEGLGSVGLFLVSPALILAVLLVVLAAFLLGRRALREGSLFTFAFAFYLALFAAVDVANTFLGTYRWLVVSFNLLSALSIWWIVILCWRSDDVPRSARVGVGLVAIAYMGWYAYVVQQWFSGQDSGDSDFGVYAVSLGNLVAVAAPFAFFAAMAARAGRWRTWRRWILPIVLALAFSAGNIADSVFNQGFTGVFVIWSLGFNLILLWPVYSVSLALFVYSILTAFSSDADADYANPNTGVGLLLLLCAGYSLLIGYQHLLAILSLLLLAGLFRPFEREEQSLIRVAEPPVHREVTVG